MHISQELNLGVGHANFDFVDIVTDDDLELFIDPCLIELQRNEWQAKANRTVESYFDVFYNLYRQNASRSEKLKLFEYTHEINATKLGYGNGDDGTGNTPEGLFELFIQIDRQLSGITLSSPADIVVFIQDFAEDCMSDMLTNILFKLLNEFTLQQCALYNHSVQPMSEDYHYWNAETHSWENYRDNCLMIENSQILLVPKTIVRHKYGFNLGDYFHKILLGRLKREKQITKKKLEEEIRNNNPDIYTYTVNSTKSDLTLLHEYHRKIPGFYSDKVMSDEELDEIAYS